MPRSRDDQHVLDTHSLWTIFLKKLPGEWTLYGWSYEHSATVISPRGQHVVIIGELRTAIEEALDEAAR